MAGIALEVCVETPTGLAVAAAAGADRVEICSGLGLGGLTAGPGLMAAAAAAPIPAHALVRPRAGGFELTADDLEACLVDIGHARRIGLDGVVIGAARGPLLDLPSLAAMMRAAGPLEITLHRVVDTLPDPVEAVDAAIRLGVARILTSGGAARAGDGAGVIARMAARAAGRVQIMAGGGVTPGSAVALVAAGADALHASCTVPAPCSGVLGLPDARRTDPAAIRALRAAMPCEAAA